MNDQIQIKIEHSTEHISDIRSSKNENVHSNKEITTISQQQYRYSLREKRKTTFANLLDIADHENYNDKDYVRDENGSNDSSASEQEDKYSGKDVEIKRNTTKNRVRSTLKEKSFKCKICSREFTSLLRMKHHFKKQHDLKRSTNDGISKCKINGCTAYFLSTKQLQYHGKLEHNSITKEQQEVKIGNGGKRFVCSKCGKGFPTKTRLKNHIEYHKDPSEWKWECGLCGRKSPLESKLKHHMKIHKNKCQFCGEKFRDDLNLRNHLRLEHVGEKHNSGFGKRLLN